MASGWCENIWQNREKLVKILKKDKADNTKNGEWIRYKQLTCVTQMVLLLKDCKDDVIKQNMCSIYLAYLVMMEGIMNLWLCSPMQHLGS